MDEFVKSSAKVASYTPPRRKIMPEFDPSTPVTPSVPVAPTLKALKVGEEAVFPTEQRSSVYATIYRLRKDYKRQGWDVKIVENEDDYNVVIRRVS
jgi:hypothetical protein